METLLFKLNFKRIALANKLTVTDSGGNVVSYSHQKLLKIKERILFYADSNKTQELAEVNASKVIDFNVQYVQTNASGEKGYTLRRRGRQSLWKADYEITDSADQLAYKIHEGNPWVKVIDALIGQVPILGLFTGYFFNVEYLVSNAEGEDIYSIKKEPSFFEASFLVKAGTGQDMSVDLLQIISVAIMRERMRS